MLLWVFFLLYFSHVNITPDCQFNFSAFSSFLSPNLWRDSRYPFPFEGAPPKSTGRGSESLDHQSVDTDVGQKKMFMSGEPTPYEHLGTHLCYRKGPLVLQVDQLPAGLAVYEYYLSQTAVIQT